MDPFPEIAHEMAIGQHRERIAIAEQSRLARASRAATAQQPHHRPLSEAIRGLHRIASNVHKGRAERGGSVSVPCPMGAC